MKKYLLPLLTAAFLFAGQTLHAAEGVVGRVVEISATSITVNSEGSKKTFALDASTTVMGLSGKGVIADVKTGYLVKVLPGASDTAPAAKVKIFKAE